MRAQISDTLISLALRARGYNNSENDRVSGEKFLLEQILPPLAPRVCIDIGANTGDYSAALIRNTSASVYAFEPVGEAFSRLQALQRSCGSRLRVFNKGIGSENSVRDIHYSPSTTSHASFSEEIKQVPYVKNERSESVEVITLDSFVESEGLREIDFIKIDTEGFEYEVLRGGQKVISELRPKLIQIEYNWHHLFRSHTLYSLSALVPGYVVAQLLPNELRKRDPKDPLSNLYAFSNFVFVREDLCHRH